MTETMLTRRPGRRLNHLRFILDRRVTPATVLDWACESHADSPILKAMNPLPYPTFSNNRICPQEALSFAARVGEILVLEGMARSNRVAIFKQNEIDYVLLSLAIIRAGGVAVPINPGMTLDALGPYLRLAEIRIVCCNHRTFTMTIGNQARLPMVDRWIFTDEAPAEVEAQAVLSEAITDVPGDMPPVSLKVDSHVLLAHTSGTTGVPKAVICTSDSIVEGIRAHYRTEPPLPWRNVGIAGPFSHLVYQIGLTTLLLSNRPTWAMDGRDAKVALETIERENINLFVAFPELYLRMYARGLDAHDLSSIRVWISVADTSQEAHMSAFCRKGAILKVGKRTLIGSVFIEPLGSSEIGGPALRRLWLSSFRTRCQRRIGRRMLGGPRVKVADTRGWPVKRGQSGRLMVKGPTLFAGYMRSGDRLRGVSADGWWATGDIVRQDLFGRFYHMDRESDVVHTATGPFYTLPAEDVLHTYPGVYEAIVFGIPVGEQHEKPIGLIWVADHRLDEGEILRWANMRIVGPSHLHTVSKVPLELIPRGLTGKVLKRELRDRYRTMHQTHQEAAHD